MICYFCGKELSKVNPSSFKCEPCSTGFIIWDADDSKFIPCCTAVYFIHGEYGIRLRFNDGSKTKTSLVKISRGKHGDDILTLLSLPYYINIDPTNIQYWIDRLKSMVAFS